MNEIEIEEIAKLSTIFHSNQGRIKNILIQNSGDDADALIFDDKWFEIKNSKQKNLQFFSNLILAFYGKNKLGIKIKKSEFINQISKSFLELFSDLNNWKIKLNERGFIQFTLKSKLKVEEKPLDKPQKEQSEPQNTPEEKEKTVIFNEKKFDIYEAKKRNFRIEMVPAYFTQHKLDLYNKYNKDIHQDEEPTEEENFKNFICSRPIIEEEFPSTIDEKEKLKVGCYHLELYLDEKLIGVVNQRILKSGLQSGYFFYEPIFKPLNLGIITSLMEIEKIKKINNFFPDFKYYYMSTYIHHNPKLTYKVDYKPVEIWCPITRKFLDFENEIVQKNLDEKLTRIAPENVKIDDTMEEFSEDLLGFLGEVWSIRKIYFKKFQGLDEYLDGEEIAVPFQDGIEECQEYKLKPDIVGDWLSKYFVNSYWLYGVLGKDIVRSFVWIQE